MNTRIQGGLLSTARAGPSSFRTPFLYSVVHFYAMSPYRARMSDSVRDSDQDREIALLREQARRQAKLLEAVGVIPDADMMLITELKDPDYPIMHVDRANNPPYIVAGKLVEWKWNNWYAIDCPAPPFNPYWGLQGHIWEKIGIDYYDATKHDIFLTLVSDDRHEMWTMEDRADRAAAVKAASPDFDDQLGWIPREVI